ncbi:MAG TPA: SRPBCC family protein [Chitinophaga sp.]|jgi:ligand-binding SRPBCC domain-containing protein|uniref:SRPBCC family protein n=1 Tax=Chitinophaga sp. TaxID=1869181 RepID=UPI002DBD40BC|nr:SRPBCC family protein [Chitinophaga sp.]HEU4551651.1 SRPBCC family protein [Chitinophaga sp.]
MPTIHLTTVIYAPMERVFNLSRSITLHKRSMAHLQEEAIKGRLNGLIEKNETVTWRARHLGKTRTLTTRITDMRSPEYFCDEMEAGDFKYMRHEHHFKAIDNATVSIDIMDFEAPYGKLGRLFTRLYLHNYMSRLLQQRNRVIKEYAETEKWRVILD